MKRTCYYLVQHLIDAFEVIVCYPILSAVSFLRHFLEGVGVDLGEDVFASFGEFLTHLRELLLEFLTLLGFIGRLQGQVLFLD